MIRVRTGYSFRTAAGKIEDVMDRLLEIGAPAAAITDRASTFGWVRWDKLAQKKGIKPVFGVELGVTNSIHEKKPAVAHWTFIPKNSISSINKLVELATEQFRYQPLLTYQQAQEAEDVFRIIGHRSLLDCVKPDPDMFFALGPSSVKGFVRRAIEKGIPPVMASDNKFVRPEDKGFYEVVCGRNAEIQSYAQHLLSTDEWAEDMERLSLGDNFLASAIDNGRAILEASTAQLQKGKLLTPEKPETLRFMCEKGAQKLGCDLTRPVYAARLERELTLIAEKDFEDYFYIVADICEFARKNMIVGPARGSSCGSLVCYLLGITTIDPIPFGLIFERFIDINRNDLPDIDIDFAANSRQLVFDYINEKYGSNRVARLGTVAMFMPKSAIRESGAALKIPKWRCEAVVESLIERSSGDARALASLEDTLKLTPAGKDLMAEFPEMIIAAKMEGHPRHYSQHAAGIVIAEKPISEFVAVDHRTGATMCDKKDAEELNLLKIDALGLKQLSIFEYTLELANLSRDIFETIPLEDQAAFDVINEGKFSGVFQFDGLALQSVSKQFTITEFNDFTCVTALARPGPLASGGTNEWLRRKNGEHAVTYPHKVFEPFLNETLGIVIYQEQVMEIGRQVGDLDWGQVTALRKAMSRSLGKEYFDQFGDPWKKGAIAKGVTPEDARKVWDDLCAYGSWSFNKSHSVAYSLISYYCAWFKAHYPFEFAAATLTYEDDPEKQLKLLREIVMEGYEYIPVDPETSTDKWTVKREDGKGILVGPLSKVKGVGPKLMQQILGARARGERMPERARKLLKNPVTDIDSLFPIRDAFKRIMPDPSERNIYTLPKNIKDIVVSSQPQEVLIFCTFSKINPRDENEAVLVAKRGYEITDGKTAYLNLFMTDDTDTIFGKIDRWKFEKLAQAIIDRGRPSKALYAVKGNVRGDASFRMISIKNVRYIGDIEEKHEDKKSSGSSSHA